MKNNLPGCTGTRRQFLLDTGMGFTGLALNAMMFRNGAAQAALPALETLCLEHWYGSYGLTTLAPLAGMPQLKRLS